MQQYGFALDSGTPRMWSSDSAKQVLSVFGYVQVQGVLKQNTEV